MTVYRCPHCGLDVDTDWGPCAWNPDTPPDVLRARIRCLLRGVGT